MGPKSGCVGPGNGSPTLWKDKQPRPTMRTQECTPTRTYICRKRIQHGRGLKTRHTWCIHSPSPYHPPSTHALVLEYGSPAAHLVITANWHLPSAYRRKKTRERGDRRRRTSEGTSAHTKRRKHESERGRESVQACVNAGQVVGKWLVPDAFTLCANTYLSRNFRLSRIPIFTCDTKQHTHTKGAPTHSKYVQAHTHTTHTHTHHTHIYTQTCTSKQ